MKKEETDISLPASIVEWADSHAHLNFPEFDDDIAEVAKSLADERFLVLNVGSDLGYAEKAIEIARMYSHMKASAGIHPHHAESVTQETLDRLRELASSEHVVAIGETGLDYFRNLSPRDAQKKALVEHLRIANEIKKPVIIHCREAFKEILPILKEYFNPDIGGVLHCFSEGVEEAKTGLLLGFHISFAGNVTYKNARKLRETAKVIPSERLLIETDCPYLPPQSKRGKRNEPSFMKETASVLAEVRGVKVEDLARITYSNYRRLFLGETPEKAEIVYRIRDSLYVNVTTNCSNVCYFCPRGDTPFVQGHYLGIERDPEAEEILEAIGEAKPSELVFCGLGEPTLRLEVVKKVAAEVKKRGLKVRLCTNGEGSLLNKRDIVPELVGLVDVLSVSLNAPDKETYNRICRPSDPDRAFDAVIEFIKKSRELLPEVVVSSVDLPEGVDMESVRDLAKSLGVQFRLRPYNMLG